MCVQMLLLYTFQCIWKRVDFCWFHSIEWNGMIYHTKWSILVQKTAALLMPDFCAKNTANICSFRKIVAPVFSSQWKRQKVISGRWRKRRLLLFSNLTFSNYYGRQIKVKKALLTGGQKSSFSLASLDLTPT